jgi:carbon-monoxide dehydrogenase medium subunit
MLNLRLAQPRLLIDITAVPELVHVETTPDAITIGACVTTADIEDGRVADPRLPMLSAVAAGIAYRAVRNRGTIGGSLCHADPAGDWMPVLCALDADCIVTDGARRQQVPLERFMQAPFEVALGAHELLEAVRIPRPSPGARWGHYKVCRKAGEFALAIGAVLVDPARDTFRAVIGATESRPIVVEDARELFGESLARGAPLLDERGARRLLEQNGLHDATARTLHLTALRRAAARTAS